jgi:hypothetical protein
LNRDLYHQRAEQSEAPFHELRPDAMDEDRGMPADALQPEHRALNSNSTPPQSPKRMREDDGEQDAQEYEANNEHENKGQNKYRQRTFQHGSRKHRGDKRKDLGRGEYLYVFELQSMPHFLHLPKIFR